MADSPATADTLGALVQAYVGEQCAVILDARFALASRDESLVHPARVAIRRLRATLRTFGGVYDADHGASFAKELRWAGLLLGDVRDLQVLAERYTEDAGSTDQAAKRVIADEIQHDRIDAWDAVTAGLSSVRGAALYAVIARWRDDPPFDGNGAAPADRAKKKVDKADARWRARLERAHAASADDDAEAGELLHDARKAAKRHRYAVELAAPVLGPHADETIDKSKELQDALGAHQDAVVALAFLKEIDVPSKDPKAASALAELIAQTTETADDVASALNEAERIRG